MTTKFKPGNRTMADDIQALAQEKGERDREEALQKALSVKAKDQFDADMKHPSVLEKSANTQLNAKKLINGDNFISYQRRATAAYTAELNLSNATYGQI
tara:strand:+ start:1087 stop:1383 length:297 start_codon:yes stop_codon:yes gene_type:complete